MLNNGDKLRATMLADGFLFEGRGDEAIEEVARAVDDVRRRLGDDAYLEFVSAFLTGVRDTIQGMSRKS